MAKAKDLTGQKFGKLTAIANTGIRGGGGLEWVCICDCGNEVKVGSYNLTSGRVKSCGCAQHAARDYTGVRRGDLVGVRKTGRTISYYGYEREVWEWRCKCGNIIERAVSQVYPQGVSCCPDCARRKRGEQCRNNILGDRVEGTTLTRKQLDNVLTGKLTSRNKSGVRGVSWAENAKKWTAHGFKDGKAIHLGYFNSIEEAAEARLEFIKNNLPMQDASEKQPPEQEDT